MQQWHYLNYCKDFSLIPLPVLESTIYYCVAYLGQQGLAHSSTSTYLSGIRQIQISHGFGDPNLDQMSCLQQVLKGVKVEAGKEGRAPHSWLPITPAILRKFMTTLGTFVQFHNVMGSFNSNFLLFLLIWRNNYRDNLMISISIHS